MGVAQWLGYNSFFYKFHVNVRLLFKKKRYFYDRTEVVKKE